MDIYIRDPFNDYKKIYVIDDYESFVWTERYSDFGDFQIIAPATQRLAEVFSMGSVITHDHSRRAMRVESLSTEEDSEGRTRLTVSGRSMEHILDTRATVRTTGHSDLIITPRYPAQAAAWIINEVCLVNDPGGYYAADRLADFSVENVYPYGNLTRFQLTPGSLFDAVKHICDSDGLGFRLLLEDTSPHLRFQIYKGVAREGIVFGYFLENLTEERILKSREDYKNVAYVWAKDYARRKIVYAPGLLAYPPTGLSRRVLNVDATDIDPTEMSEADLDEVLTQRGLEALAEHPDVSMFDGKLHMGTKHKYMFDYNLGDRVTVFDKLGTKHQGRVSEYIWAYDQEGFREYPTFNIIQ